MSEEQDEKIKANSFGDGIYSMMSDDHLIQYLIGLTDKMFSSLDSIDGVLDKMNFEEVCEVLTQTFKAKYREDNRMLVNEVAEYSKILKDLSSFIDIIKRNVESELIEDGNKSMPDNTEYYSTSKAGEELAKLKNRDVPYSKQTINNIIKSGKLKSIKIGSHNKVGNEDLRQYFESYGASLRL